MPNKNHIDTESIVEYVREELTDLLHDNIINAGNYNRKKNYRLIMRALNQADRDICLYEKYEDTVTLFIKADRTTIYFQEQSNHVKDFFDQHSGVRADDVEQFGYLIDDKSFLDVISVSSSVGYVFDDIPFRGEKSSDELKHGFFNDIYQRNANNCTQYFHVMPSQKKMLLSAPFAKDKWVKFKAKVAPKEIDVLNAPLSDLECYRIIAPYYCKAWLVVKTLAHLLPFRTLAEAGLVDKEAIEQRRTRGRKPGGPNIIYTGDDYQSGYEDEFMDL